MKGNSKKKQSHKESKYAKRLRHRRGNFGYYSIMADTTDGIKNKRYTYPLQCKLVQAIISQTNEVQLPRA